jgi:transposase InsO family protein
VCDLFKRHQLITRTYRRRSRPRAPSPFAPVTAPNELWTTDFKGEFRTRDGRYCYPLTLRDACSRYVLRCEALLHRGHEATRRQFERAFAEFGLPDRIRSDNGHPFAGIGLAGLSTLSVWWMRLGIGLERIAPGRPDQNGSHEQFHAVLKAETTRPPAATCRAQQQRFTHFVRRYNTVRPHAALGNDRPVRHYRASTRPVPKRLPPLDDPAHHEIRRVSDNGTLTWRCRAIFLGTPLAGQDVAFEEVDDGIWTLRFADLVLARYDDRTHTLRPVAPTSAGRSRVKPARAHL